MRLTREQTEKLLRERGIWITEACDKCGKLLGAVRWTRRNEPGEWCSAECRDGVPAKKPATERRCLECGVRLNGKRSDGSRSRIFVAWRELKMRGICRLSILSARLV
jgi:hypothetical protein